MVVKRILGIDVLTAAKQRIIETFNRGRRVRLSFSGGKDSIVLASIIYELIMEGKINKDLLLVVFIDEEAMYDDAIEIVKKWRMKFIEIGVEFRWYCLQVKHFNCLNSLSSDESFICWDKEKKDSWVRPMPKFAITDDQFLIPYKDTYQAFLDRQMNAYKYISMRGVRVAESVQRLKCFALQKTDSISLPIYDFSDKDIWLYILKYNVEIPIAYENLYRVGTNKNNLRISQFFSIDTARALVKLSETYPDLMARVTKREPNAYLCMMYWDTEMFGRKTKKRKELEKGEKKDYKKLVFDILRDKYPLHPYVVKKIRPYIIGYQNLIDDKIYESIYNVLMCGDPKGRTCRSIIIAIFKNREKEGKAYGK